MKELPFGVEMAIIELPGKVIAESIKSTRSTPEKEAPNYLHVDADCSFDPKDAKKLMGINKKPLDPKKLYQVAIYQFLLGGMNEIEPLLSYVKQHVKVPSLETCLPAKNLVMETCMKRLWRRIIGDSSSIEAKFAELDRDGSGDISKAELTACIDQLDNDSDPNNDVPLSLVIRLMEALDVNHDGKISLMEFKTMMQ